MTTTHADGPRPTCHRPDDDTEVELSANSLPLWRIGQTAGRNALVSASRRVETLVVALAVVIMLVALPVAVAVGSAIYDSRSRRHAEQAQTTRVVTGTVTSRNVAYHESLGPTITVLARWFAGGDERTGAVPAPPGVKPGDPIDISVAEDGSAVRPPIQTAYDEAVAVGVAVWFGVAAAAAALVGGTRAALDRNRRPRWQADFGDLIRAGNGRTAPA